MKKYTESHEWIEVDGDVGTIGITNFAQDELGELVYVELPEKGQSVKAGQEAVVLESTKAAADVYTPVSGEITEVNEQLRNAPERVNERAETTGWLFKVRLSDSKELEALLDEEKYRAMVG